MNKLQLARVRISQMKRDLEAQQSRQDRLTRELDTLKKDMDKLSDLIAEVTMDMETAWNQPPRRD